MKTVKEYFVLNLMKTGLECLIMMIGTDVVEKENQEIVNASVALVGVNE